MPPGSSNHVCTALPVPTVKVPVMFYVSSNGALPRRCLHRHQVPIGARHRQSQQRACSRGSSVVRFGGSPWTSSRGSAIHKHGPPKHRGGLRRRLPPSTFPGLMHWKQRGTSARQWSNVSILCSPGLFSSGPRIVFVYFPYIQWPTCTGPCDFGCCASFYGPVLRSCANGRRPLGRATTLAGAIRAAMARRHLCPALLPLARRSRNLHPGDRPIPSQLAWQGPTDCHAWCRVWCLGPCC